MAMAATVMVGPPVLYRRIAGLLNKRPPADQRIQLLGLFAHRPYMPESLSALCTLREALDELAHVLLPPLVHRIVGQLRHRGLVVVALDQVEQVPAASPDAPVVDAGLVHDGDQFGPDAGVLELVGLFGTGDQPAVQC